MSPVAKLLASTCQMLILIIGFVFLTQFVLRKSYKNVTSKRSILNRREKCVILSFVILVSMFIYHIVYMFHLGYYVYNSTAIPFKENPTLKIFELLIENFQRSLPFYAITVFMPCVLSKRPRIPRFEENVLESFVEWYSILKVLMCLTIVVPLKSNLELATYLASVLGISETILLLLVYFLLFYKTRALKNGFTGCGTAKYRTKIFLVESGHGSTLMFFYLLADIIFKIIEVTSEIVPHRNTGSFDVYTAARTIFFSSMCLVLIKCVLLSESDICKLPLKRNDGKRVVTFGPQNGDVGGEMITVATI